MNNRELARTTCFDNMSAFAADALGELITTGMGIRQGTRKAKPAGGTATAPNP